MAKNKVIYNGQTLIDLTDTTAEASDVASGKYFYGKDGVKTQGGLSFSTIRTGTTVPSSSLGSNGDVYIQTQ
jgi:hypothetical protein